MGKKLKLILIIGIPVLVIALSVCGGYWFGYGSGKDVGHNEGFISGNTTVPKNVSYKEVVAFLTNDQTDKVEYSAKDFDCTSFSNMVRNNAIEKGIKCGLVSFDLVSPQKIVGHVILIFETTDKGIVYFDPQTDGQRYDIRVGGTYTLSGVVYKITKVDLIW
jgi:hypothetical protein